MNSRETVAGHLAALLTILIWGTTFIATKILLRSFSPVEILFSRFFIGYLALWAVMPRRLKVGERKQEIYFMAAGLCGVTLYFLLENFALTFTLAANVGVIISIAPFFTAIFGWLFGDGDSGAGRELSGGDGAGREPGGRDGAGRGLGDRGGAGRAPGGRERPGVMFFAGFALAMAGIYLISFRGGQGPRVSPVGDGLAVLAAIVWAIYGTLTKRISRFGYGTVQTTRRTFFYGLLFMAPVLAVSGYSMEPGSLARFFAGGNLFNLLFLGLGASALCFVTWNFAVKLLGPVKTSVYIYLVPVITVVTSVAILDEKIGGAAVCGILLALAGLILSETKIKIRRKERHGLVRSEVCHGDR